jgi:integrase
MRPNPHGIRYFRAKWQAGRLVYYWLPPESGTDAELFKYRLLGSDFLRAAAAAKEWNQKLDTYRATVGNARDKRPVLEQPKPMSAAFIARTFEKSLRFCTYSSRTQEEYPRFYRRIEIFKFDGERMFGDLHVDEVTRQLVYSVYEYHVHHHGLDNANKIMSAWQAAFKHATLKIDGVTLNPFTQLGMTKPPPRRQRWTHEQLDAFIRMSDRLGYPSIGRCALMCMELVQRPGDILSLQWSNFHKEFGAWHIRQSKRGAQVWVPETERLRAVLDAERERLSRGPWRNDITNLFVCPTKTGRRWIRRNFTKTARLIARHAGIPDDLQIRDLRRTAATEGASAGATPWEMMAVGGWQTQSSIRPYFVGTSEQAASFQRKRELYRANEEAVRSIRPTNR